jgi:hypothetical protein
MFLWHSNLEDHHLKSYTRSNAVLYCSALDVGLGNSFVRCIAELH